MNDLIGLGKGVEKLIDAISNAVGVLYEPHRIRRQGEAESYKEKLIAEVRTEAQANEILLLTKAKLNSFELISEAKFSIQERIAAKKAYQEYRKQLNLEKVIEFGVNNVTSSVSDAPVDNDWINKLIKYAENATSENMQLLWGKVLAGEVGVPGSFSLKSLEVLQKMTRSEADAFQTACNISSINNFSKERMLVHGFTSHSFYSILFPASQHELALIDYLRLPDMFTLQSIGLIHERGLVHGRFSRGEKFTLLNNGEVINLTARKSAVGLLMYKFTEIGNELSKLIPDKKNDEYLHALVTSLSKAFKVSIGSHVC